MNVINALVIDDEADARGFLVGTLQSGGLTVAEATTAEEALAQLHSFKPELIVADVNLPGISGYDLCRHVREMGHDDIPFIFCSALGGLPERIRGLRMGGDAYLVKPVAAEELLLHVRLHLERTRRVRKLQESVAVPQGEALTGKLEDVSLLETLQLLDMRGRGEVWVGIDTADDHGELFTSGRELVHASTRALTGHKALLRMLSWTTGTFRMEGRSWLAEPSLNGRIDHVLFDATAEVDEARNLRGRLPSDKLALASTPGLFSRVYPETTLQVLRLVEQHGEVERVLEATELPDSEVLRVLLELTEAGLVVPRGDGNAPALPAPVAVPVNDAAAPEAWDEMLRELRREYLGGALERARHLREALEALEADGADPEALHRARRLFHAFAGSGTTYGFPVITARGTEGERRCIDLQQDRRPAGRDQIATLRRLLQDIDDALVAEIPSSAPWKTERAAGPEPRRVLVVDPSEGDVAELMQALRADGMTVERVSSSAEALALVAERPHDAYVVELRTGESRGIDLVRQLKEMPSAEDAAIVVIGAPGEFLDKVEAIQAGADAVLEKPVLASVAVRSVKRLLDRSATPPGKVLAVDGDPAQAAFYNKVLGAAGYEVRICAEPKELEAELAAFSPDLVLLDVVQAAGVDGYALARFIRQDDRYATLPVLFTSQPQARARVHAARVGADDVLVKPLLAWLLLPAVAARIERARLLRSLVDHDGLTRLLAHSAFVERAQSMLAQAVRDKHRRIALAFVDVDDMAGLNTRHGHVAGDRVLAACGALLRKRLRHSDVIGRFGADQFAVVLDDLEPPDAVRLVMRLRDEFGGMEHATSGGPVKATFSAGIAMLNPSGMDLPRWLRSAEEALEDARRTGTGRVRLAAVEVQSPA